MGNLTKRKYILMLFSLLIAIFLWATVMDIKNPEINYVYKSVPIELQEGTDGPESNGMSILDGDNQTVNITVMGRRTDISSIDVSAVKAYADMSGINEAGEYSIPINVTIPNSVSLVSKSPEKISVSIDKITSVQIPVRIVTDVTAAEGYIISEQTMKPDKITVKGPKEILDTLSYGQVMLKAGSISKDLTLTQAIVLYNKNGVEVKDSGLEMSKGSVEISITVLRRKTVPIQIVYDGNKSDLDTGIISVSPEQVTIQGEESVIENISSISTNPVSISQLLNGGKAVASLNIPNGVTVTEGDTCEVYWKVTNVQESPISEE